MEGGGVIVKPGKWDYFFGRVTSTPKNQARSQRNLNNLKKLGIDEAIGGRNRLRKIFKAGLKAPEVKPRTTNAYGVTVTRQIKIVNGEVQGAIETGYLYRNGNLSSIPEVTTIIVKIYK